MEKKENKAIAFVIMQIGNKELDRIYTEVFIPAIRSVNLEPIRIDQDNEGGLLKKEIIENLEKADIIIADLTNERPNCYLEVGYTMGIDKYSNLIITVREDHSPESPNHKIGGPKIHFDLSGYDIIFWDPIKLDEFKTTLVDKINRRQLIIAPKPNIKEKPLWDDNWLEQQRAHVKENFQKIESKRQMETLISPVNIQLNMHQLDLLETADYSQMPTGWPIGIIFRDVPNLKPISKSDGILSEVHGNVAGDTYDYSYFRKNGQIFLSNNIYEDRSHPKAIIPDIRIEIMAEMLMFVSRFYSKCNLPVNERIKITVKFTGLIGSAIGSADGGISILHGKTSKENESISEIVTSISEIESKLPELVSTLVNNLFVLFDFYNLNFEYIKLKVDEFVIQTNRKMRP